MFAAMPIVLIYGMIVEGFKVWYFVITCVMTLLSAYSIYWLWPLCFGELTLTEGYVKWHALFMRSVKVPYSELRYVEIRHFDEGNVVPDLYGTGQMYLLLSSKSLRFLYKGIIIKHNKTEPTYTKTSLFLCEKRRFFMARTEKGVVATI